MNQPRDNIEPLAQQESQAFSARGIDYRFNVDHAPVEDDNPAIFVEPTPMGMIDFATSVSGDNADLTQSLIALKESAGSVEYQNYLDTIIANCRSFELNDDDPQNGLELTVRTLLGDEEAVMASSLNLKALQAAHEELRARGDLLPGDDVSEEIIRSVQEPIRLVAVHTTNGLHTDSDGFWLKPAGEHQRLQGAMQVPRATIHFSLNHPVNSSAMYGDFSSRRYTILADLGEMMRRNGAPSKLNGVDTFFTIGPYEKLAIQDALVIDMENTDLDQQESVVFDGKSLKFRQGAVDSNTFEQLDKIAEDVGPEKKYPRRIRNYIERKIQDACSDKAELAQLIEGGVNILDEYLGTSNSDLQRLLTPMIKEQLRRYVINEILLPGVYDTVGGVGIDDSSVDQDFGDRVRTIAREAGLGTGMHANTAEALAERDAYVDRGYKWGFRSDTVPIQQYRLLVESGMVNYGYYRAEKLKPQIAHVALDGFFI